MKEMKTIVVFSLRNNVHWWIVYTGICIRTVNRGIWISCRFYQNSCMVWAHLQRHFYPIIQALKYEISVRSWSCAIGSVDVCASINLCFISTDWQQLQSWPYLVMQVLVLNLGPLGTDILENVLAKMTTTSPKIHINL